MRRILVLFAALGALAAAEVTAFTTGIPAAGLPSASDYSGTVLPEKAGIVSWRTLAQVQPVKQGGKMVPEFSKDILALDRKSVKIQGFIIPLDMGDKQKRFLLTAVPPHCSFCLPAGPDAVVEVQAKHCDQVRLRADRRRRALRGPEGRSRRHSLPSRRRRIPRSGHRRAGRGGSRGAASRADPLAAGGVAAPRRRPRDRDGRDQLALPARRRDGPKSSPRHGFLRRIKVSPLPTGLVWRKMRIIRD